MKLRTSSQTAHDFEKFGVSYYCLARSGRNDGVGGSNPDAHTLLKNIYNDTSLPLYARLDAARIAIRHETPTIAASKPLGGPHTDLPRQLEEGRKRAEELNRRVLEEKQRRIDQNAPAIRENDE